MEARQKFLLADKMVLHTGWQDDLDEIVARYLAKRFSGTVAVLGTVTGIEAIALAASGLKVFVNDRDTRAASANALAYGLQAKIKFENKPHREFIKLHSVDYYLLKDRKLVSRALKRSKGVALLGGKRNKNCEYEVISLDGNLTTVSWYGGLKTTTRRATTLPDEYTLVPGSAEPEYSKPLNYIYDPDPSVRKVGLINEVAQLIGAKRLGEDSPLLTSNNPMSVPFARTHKLVLVLSPERIDRTLKSMKAGRVTVKQRGVNQKIKGKLYGENDFVLFLTKVKGRPQALLTEQPL